MKLPGLLVLLAALPLGAQNTRGYFSGTITDPVGAAVTGVGVAIHNLENGARSTTLTNDQGIYRFAAVEPGPDRITYSRDGFQGL